MATSIVNFVKNHFQDNSVYADVSPRQSSAYETATINAETGVYCKLRVASEGGGNLSITDGAGNTRHLTADKNIIIRDYITDGRSNAIQNKIKASSSAVIHGIDGVLNYKPLVGGRYDSDWANLSAVKKYLKTYRLVK